MHLYKPIFSKNKLKIIKNISDFKTSVKTTVTIGTFDGVHVGHQSILKNLIKTSKESNTKSVLFTFFPHPRVVIQKKSNIKLINTLEEKIELLKKTGLDYLIIHPFDKEFSKLTSLEFVKNILIDKLNVQNLVIGYDHHFGKNREGNFDQLLTYSKKYNFNIQEISAQDIGNTTVSSTKIRKAIEKGEIRKASNYLGYEFMLTGKIVEGEKLGTKLGFPTANIYIEDPYKIIPKTGVYLVKSELNTITYFGMMNIGYRPTIDGKNQTIEVHFFDLDENLYHKNISIKILQFLRDEKKFESLEQLKSQLKLDKSNSLKIVKNLSSIS